MATTIAAGGARVDGWFFCPHHPRASSRACASSATAGSPSRAWSRRGAGHAIDLRASFVVGDKNATSTWASPRVGDDGVSRADGAGRGRAGARGWYDAGRRDVAPDLWRRRLDDRGHRTGRDPTTGWTEAANGRSRLRQIVGRLESPRLVVAGDLIADEFIYGRVERVSREAPVLILRYDATEIVPGGAGNAANNAAALGARVDVIGVAGTDDAGRRLLEALPPGASTDRSCGVGIPDADQDPNPCGRRALGQAAGRPHRSRRRALAPGVRRRHVERGSSRALVAAPTPSSSPTTAAASSRRRSGGAARTCRGSHGRAPSRWSIRATRWRGSRA